MVIYKIKSGIYQWKSLDNGEIYIGSAIHLSRRKSAHLTKLRLGNHNNKKLQIIFNRYGEYRLQFSIIEFVKDEYKLLEREQYYIDTLKPCFNICKIAGATRGVPAWNKGIPMPKEVIRKQLDTKNSRIYEKRTISESHKKAISVKNTGRVKTIEQIKSFTERRKLQIPWNKGLKYVQVNANRKPVIQLSLSGDYVTEFPSIEHANKHFGKRLNISIACRENRMTGGFKWQYK